MKRNWIALKTRLFLNAKVHYQKVGMTLLVLVFVLLYFSQSSQEAPKTTESPDTYIPSGFVLVPIDVVNREALQSLLGNYGVVDLYIPSLEPGKTGRKAASRVKILRAPLNPDEFAVLVRESDANQLVHHESGFFVVIQNPKQGGMRIVKPIVKRNRLTYEDG